MIIMYETIQNMFLDVRYTCIDSTIILEIPFQPFPKFWQTRKIY